jgi:hypothetical protein
VTGTALVSGIAGLGVAALLMVDVERAVGLLVLARLDAAAA